jgi:hypothetical protein
MFFIIKAEKMYTDLNNTALSKILINKSQLTV